MNHLAIISEAIAANKLIRVEYRDVKGDVTVRQLYPATTVRTKAGHLLVKGLCEYRNDFRSFRVDRVKQVEIC